MKVKKAKGKQVKRIRGWAILNKRDGEEIMHGACEYGHFEIFKTWNDARNEAEGSVETAGDIPDVVRVAIEFRLPKSK